MQLLTPGRSGVLCTFKNHYRVDSWEFWIGNLYGVKKGSFYGDIFFSSWAWEVDTSGGSQWRLMSPAQSIRWLCQLRASESSQGTMWQCSGDTKCGVPGGVRSYSWPDDNVINVAIKIHILNNLNKAFNRLFGLQGWLRGVTRANFKGNFQVDSKGTLRCAGMILTIRFK